MPRFFAPRAYENPLTEQGRARTIASFHVAQGNEDRLTDAEMRRDVLNKLMSPRAVSYWLHDKEWLQSSRKVGRVELLRLTDAGLRTCINSIAGGSDVPTTPDLVDSRRQAMLTGANGHHDVRFADLEVSPSVDSSRVTQSQQRS